ncbi:MAG: sensor histidine kinase [Acidimicrobiales bacterium]
MELIVGLVVGLVSGGVGALLGVRFVGNPTHQRPPAPDRVAGDGATAAADRAGTAQVGTTPAGRNQDGTTQESTAPGGTAPDGAAPGEVDPAAVLESAWTSPPTGPSGPAAAESLAPAASPAPTTMFAENLAVVAKLRTDPGGRLAGVDPLPVPSSNGSGGDAPVRDLAWVRADRFDRVLDALPLGVVVAVAAGTIRYRTALAGRYERGRHGDALVEAAIEEGIEEARSGRAAQRPLDLFGPPARSLVVRATPIQGPDGVAGVVVVIDDITRAQEIDRVRRDFVANVSHELRTPVGAIGLLAETLCDTDDQEAVDRLAGRLHHEAIRLGDLIDDLLALSKLESGQVDEPVRVDLAEVVEIAHQRATTAAAARGIRVNVSLPDPDGGQPLTVDGDRRQIVSAVANLIDNAIKYSDPNGTVTVAVRRTGSSCVISVADDGVGIPDAALGRIFERFYRGDDARSRQTGGTGLGLSIVRHVTINHRGTVSVRSTEGVGSTFTMQLPAAEPEPS